MPHGVFEIPALLLAASSGLWLVVMVVRRRRGKESTLLRFYIEHAFRRYFAIVFPLLIVAAAIDRSFFSAPLIGGEQVTFAPGCSRVDPERYLRFRYISV